MALDLNKPVDEGDEQALPDLNDEIAEVEIHLGQEEDQLGGDVQGGDKHVFPFDLNIDAPGHQGEMNPDNGDAMDQVLQLYGGHIHNAFPFDINSDALKEHLQMQADEPKFVDMRNIVHIDEKWFNTTKKTRNFYMVHWEDDPYRPVQNKNSIDKVMFLAAVARPRYNEEGTSTKGKPKQAKRDSCHQDNQG
ncbi:hypothetical protein OsJ_17656 [Oryza sativa Japonica Group]|uniref:Uncharacterized protein n=1 Tax=Oryza sativa subsp. japonica TaxID=39947 RepID=B9FN98_ORYSJ|nr:hypothetical protein OsJ_17656 [Oryza sativa Japonica Group]